MSVLNTINYSELGLKTSNEVKVYPWKRTNITISKYLPIGDKYDVVMITLQKSLEDGIYNPIKLDMFFHLNLIYIYTNLIFTEEERADEEHLFDEIVSSGFLDEFLKHINKEDYDEMLKYIKDISELKMKYSNSAGGILNRFVTDLPQQAEAVQKIIDNFDKEKYQNVIDFAKSVNNGNL